MPSPLAEPLNLKWEGAGQGMRGIVERRLMFRAARGQ